MPASDINKDLIDTYLVVRDQVDSLLRDLSKHRHEKEYFYQIRGVDRTPNFRRWGAVRRASRLMYLNKTCYNGLYRVNSKGEFNAPFGDYKNPNFRDKSNLLACSKLLCNAKIVDRSFEFVVAEARKKDFVYFDPPYAPLNATSNFTGYSKDGFSTADQIRLRDVCKELDKKRVSFMLSNSSAPLILDLYKEFNVEYVEAKRAINSKGNRRGTIKEVIITNY